MVQPRTVATVTSYFGGIETPTHAHIHTPTHKHTHIQKQARINRLNSPNTLAREENPQTHSNN